MDRGSGDFCNKHTLLRSQLHWCRSTMDLAAKVSEVGFSDTVHASY